MTTDTIPRMEKPLKLILPLVVGYWHHFLISGWEYSRLTSLRYINEYVNDIFEFDETGADEDRKILMLSI